VKGFTSDPSGIGREGSSQREDSKTFVRASNRRYENARVLELAIQYLYRRLRKESAGWRRPLRQLMERSLRVPGQTEGPGATKKSKSDELSQRSCMEPSVYDHSKNYALCYDFFAQANDYTRGE
jgi:hypothetical protein